MLSGLIRRILPPQSAYTEGANTGGKVPWGDHALVRCDCGELMRWGNKKKLNEHIGHKQKLATHGTPWEYFKMRVGLI